MFVRRLAAVSADSPVDLNRDLADKPVGVRTLALVALGAATVSMAGIEVRQWPKAPEVPRSASQSPAALDLALDCDRHSGHAGDVVCDGWIDRVTWHTTSDP